MGRIVLPLVAGTTYAVSISGVSMPISYEVQLVDCN